jgi:hypothetical protein
MVSQINDVLALSNEVRLDHKIMYCLARRGALCAYPKTSGQ